MAQNTIHASPIAPTFGKNVDHQVSLRTPHLSGQDRAELTRLGVQLLFQTAKSEFGSRGPWSKDVERAWKVHALMDEHFDEAFDLQLRKSGTPVETFNLNPFT